MLGVGVLNGRDGKTEMIEIVFLWGGGVKLKEVMVGMGGEWVGDEDSMFMMERSFLGKGGISRGHFEGDASGREILALGKIYQLATSGEEGPRSKHN